MLATTFLQPILLLLLTLIVHAAPLEDRAKAVHKNFYLLAAPKKSVTSKKAIGLNLFDPFSGPDFFLRRQEGGASYSQFNLTSGMLTALEFPPRNVTARVTFESNVDESTGEVIFHQAEGTKGQLSFVGKFLAYKDDVSGFTACEGELSETIIVYNGTDASCEKVYIFQQLTPPSST